MREDVKDEKFKNDSVPNKGRMNNRKERRSRSREQRKGNKSKDEFYKKTRGSNDLSWHTPDAELLHRTAMIPWSYQTGESIEGLKQIATSGLPDGTEMISQPGFMVIRDHMAIGGIGMKTPGDTTYYGDLPSFNAANSLLTTMRSRTRVRNTYDAPDVFMLMCAAANIYGAVAWFKRLAATVRMFTYQNHYLPELLLRAQGVDPDWFKKNQYTFVTELNVIISEINKIYIPSRMHLFELYNQRFSNYYTEGDSIKDQIYCFVPAFLSIIDYDADSDYVSTIKPIACIPGTLTYNETGHIVGTKYDNHGMYTGTELLTILREMVYAIISHDSTADITGDMENAFGSGERFILAGCDPEAIAAPVFDEEILETIHNMQISAFVTSEYQRFDSTVEGYNKKTFCTCQQVTSNKIGTFDLFEHNVTDNDRNLLRSEMSFTLLDVHKDPTPEKTFAITRLRNFPKSVTTVQDTMYVQVEFGADLICQAECWQWSYRTDTLERYWEYIVYASCTRLFSNVIAFSSPFHYRPLQRIVRDNFVPEANRWYCGETDIYAVIPDLKTLQNMNRISLLTLLGAYNNI